MATNGIAIPAENSDLEEDVLAAAGDTDADGKGGGLKEDILGAAGDSDADGKSQASAGKIQASAGSADDKPEEWKPPASGIFSDILTPARGIFSEILTPARGIFSKIFTPARAAFALFTTLALWLAADRPERVVWIFSVIACSYLALWTICLTAAISPRTVLFSISYIALLAGSLTHLSSAVGIFVMLLDMAYSAGLLGYALAEYRQRKGTERSAEEVPTRSEEELKKQRGAFALCFFYSAIASLACAAFAVRLVLRYTVDTYWLVVGLSLLMHITMFCWTVLTLSKLHGALARDIIAFMYFLSIILFLPDFLLSYLFGNTIGMLVHPLGVMAVTGLLGYSLAVHARYKQMKNTLEAKKAD